MAQANRTLLTRPVFSWALYDWANSAFATTVIAGFFPLFFKQYWSHGTDPSESTFQLGVANAVASLIVAVLAPVLGAIADRSSGAKRYLLLFASLGILMTFSLSLVGQGHWVVAAAVYALAGVGFAGSNVFYDALILHVSPREQLSRVSSFGFALGYLGGGVLFAINVAMTLKPEFFGLADAPAAVRASFVCVAVWWAVFSLPLLFWVHQAPAKSEPSSPIGHQVREGLAQLIATVRVVLATRTVWTFLLAYWLYIDGVHTIIRMAVDYGLSLGFDANTLIVALLMTQFIGFPAALFFGWLGHRIGPKAGIYIGLLVYTAVTIWGYLMESSWEFYVLAGAIGLVQGAVQALSRSLYASLIPAEQSAQYFGFYNMLGKFAAILGPLLVGVVALVTGSTRVSILSVIILFALGGLILYWVPEPKSRA